MICQMLHNADAVAAPDDEWGTCRACRHRQDWNYKRPRTSTWRHGLCVQLFRADGLSRKILYCSSKTCFMRSLPAVIHWSVIWLAVWLSGNALASINVVALRQTRLVPGWVTVCGRVNHLGMYNQPARSTQPSTLCGTVKWVSAFGLSNNN